MSVKKKVIIISIIVVIISALLAIFIVKPWLEASNEYKTITSKIKKENKKLEDSIRNLDSILIHLKRHMMKIYQAKQKKLRKQHNKR